MTQMANAKTIDPAYKIVVLLSTLMYIDEDKYRSRIVFPVFKVVSNWVCCWFCFSEGEFI